MTTYLHAIAETIFCTRMRMCCYVLYSSSRVNLLGITHICSGDVL